MSRPGRRAAPALLTALLAVPVAAAEAPLSLADALARAEGQNPDLLALRERAVAQAEGAEATRRQAWPRLSFATGWTRTDNPALVFAQKLNAAQLTQADFGLDRLNAPAPLFHLTTTLALEVPVDVFGRVSARAEGEKAIGRAAAAGAAEGTQELRLRVIEVYRQAEVARRAVAVTEHALGGARAREADIEARVLQGAALPADRLRARARRRQREADLAERRGEASVAAATLGRLLGAPPGTEYRPTEPPPAPVPLEGDASAWTARALERRPGLSSARQRSEAARLRERGERRSLLPDIGLYAQVQDDRSSPGGNQTATVGASLRWSAFDPTRDRRVAAARAEGLAAEQEARAATDQVRLEVETAWRRAQAARERYLAAMGGAEEGREALRVVQERRRAGMATLTDELETEAASLAAELEEMRAAADVAIADAALRRAAGEI